MQVVLAYITTKDKAEARKLGELLLNKKVAACVNILPVMESHYVWKGKRSGSKEAVLIAKTLSKHRKNVLALIKEHHSYECPCILFIDVKTGNRGYLKWLADSVS